MTLHRHAAWHGRRRLARRVGRARAGRWPPQRRLRASASAATWRLAGTFVV